MRSRFGGARLDSLHLQERDERGGDPGVGQSRVRLRGLSEVGKRQRMKGRLMKYYQRVYSHMMGGNVRERRCVKGS